PLSLLRQMLVPRKSARRSDCCGAEAPESGREAEGSEDLFELFLRGTGGNRYAIGEWIELVRNHEDAVGVLNDELHRIGLAVRYADRRATIDGRVLDDLSDIPAGRRVVLP